MLHTEQDFILMEVGQLSAECDASLSVLHFFTKGRTSKILHFLK